MDSQDKTILIVDDEPDIRAFLEDLLTAQGYQCEAADSGPAALSKLGHMKPDLVLLDIMMPGMSGLEVLRQIKERPDFEAGVVMISCLTHPNTTLRALDEGADHFVVKPFRVHELLQTLDQVLERRGTTPS